MEITRHEKVNKLAAKCWKLIPHQVDRYTNIRVYFVAYFREGCGIDKFAILSMPKAGESAINRVVKEKLDDATMNLDYELAKKNELVFVPGVYNEEIFSHIPGRMKRLNYETIGFIDNIPFEQKEIPSMLLYPPRPNVDCALLVGKLFGAVPNFDILHDNGDLKIDHKLLNLRVIFSGQDVRIQRIDTDDEILKRIEHSCKGEEDCSIGIAIKFALSCYNRLSQTPMSESKYYPCWTPVTQIMNRGFRTSNHSHLPK